MKPKLYLHIGGGKTGSSAIQSFLSLNRQKLRKEGLFYPQPLVFDRVDSINHSPIFVRLQNQQPENKGPFVNRVIHALINQSKKNNFPSIVISHEGMSSDNLFVQRLIKRDFFDLRVILYVRDQISWIESGWKQWGIKHRECETIQDWVELIKTHPFWSLQVDWNAALEKWEKVVPAENIDVRLYDRRQLYEADVVADFMHHLGYDDLRRFRMPDQASSVSANRGFNNTALEFIRRSKRFLVDVHDNRLFKLLEETTGDKYLKKPFDEYSLLSEEARREIRDYYSESNRMLRERYFPDREILFEYRESQAPAASFDMDRYLTLLTEIVSSQALEVREMLGKKENQPLVESYPITALMGRMLPRKTVIDHRFDFENKTINKPNVNKIEAHGKGLRVELEKVPGSLILVLPLEYDRGDTFLITIAAKNQRGIRGSLNFYDRESRTFRDIDAIKLNSDKKRIICQVRLKAPGDRFRIILGPLKDTLWRGSIGVSKLDC